MANELPHITVCVCTFKRATFLGRLMRGLGGQQTDGLFTYSILVVDNDASRSAEMAVAEIANELPVAVQYFVEPQQNISMARNRAVANAKGEFLAFIDDDEFAGDKWLLTLFEACRGYNSDGALGPVKPHFEVRPPRWVVRGGFYDRPSYPTGLVIDGKKGRTGNLLLKSRVFETAGPQAFRPELRSGEDQDFFSRMISHGCRFVWCHEAMAYETVPPIRWKRSFMLRRALLRGGTAIHRRGFGPKEVAKSLVAVPLFLLALPFALLSGQHRFMKLLVSLFDHVGKLLAILDWNPVRDPYVTE